MIFARDKSQMCNNLLQYAHVYAWGREHGRRVVSMRFSYKYPYFKISHSPLASFPLYVLAKFAAALHILPTASFKHDDCDAASLERKMLRHRHIVVSGWYVRYYDLFLKYRSEICDLFTISPAFTEPVEVWMKQFGGLRLGVHVRRGDYAEWHGGAYLFDDRTYAAYIRRFAELWPGRPIDAFVATNDSSLRADVLEGLVALPQVRVRLLGGNAVEDLHMLSQCDYLIGPPSTYSLVAAMYRDVPLCRMDSAEVEAVTADSFRKFDYWFRRVV